MDSTGLVQAVGGGRAVVTATSGSATGTAAITVTTTDSDRTALLALYDATNGSRWRDNTNWLTEMPLDQWYGVHTDSEGRVTHLHLSANVLTGAVPPQVGHLARLKTLDLSYNSLSGPIPSTFLQLSLDEFQFGRNDGFCAPGTRDFIAWAALIDGQPDPVPGPATYSGPFCNAGDVRALESLYEAADGENWTNSDGWVDAVRWIEVGAVGAPADWYGVTADSLGRVRSLRLSHNGLSGRVPPDLWRLTALTELWIDGNELSGPLPVSLASLPLLAFHYAGTELCTAADESFHEWLSNIASHRGTGIECTSSDYLYVLMALYEATGGAHWIRADNWLTAAPPEEWYGIELDEEGRIIGLALEANGLAGQIPSELGDLSFLSHLSLDDNRLEGLIPAALGDLTQLVQLSLSRNSLRGSVPSAFGDLRSLKELRIEDNDLGGYPRGLGNLHYLEVLDLSGNQLRYGSIWPEFGDLSRLRVLDLSDNRMLTAIPAELGNLSGLEILDLSGNDLANLPPELGSLTSLRVLDLSHEPNPPRGLDYRLTGGIPASFGSLERLEVLDLSHHHLDFIPQELGDLTELRVLNLNHNRITHIPPELGKLLNLRELLLSDNELMGAVPAELGNLVNLQRLVLMNNRMLSGPLPTSLTGLGLLGDLRVSHTRLCVPSGVTFEDWLQGTGAEGLPRCAGSNAYLTQAVQSLHFPVPLIADEPALLRVFLTAPEDGGSSMPPVRARFYGSGTETYTIDIPGRPDAIPTEMDEGSLGASANVEIPSWVIQPGLEMVIEIDPDGTGGALPGVEDRIPPGGRIPVEVAAVPTLDLTVIPLLYGAAPDSSILEVAAAWTSEDSLFWPARTLLPVADLAVAVHEPVVTTTNRASDLAREIRAIWTMEGAGGYYLGTMAGSTIGDGAGYTRYRASFAIPDRWVIARQLGRNMGLSDAPCGSTHPDPQFPNADGTIGAWGYDFRDSTLIPPDTPDLMTLCEPKWVSEYHFTKAFRHRLEHEANAVTAAGIGPPVETVFVWGGVDEHGTPFLEPAFIVDAHPALPRPGGEFELTGRAADGSLLFSLSFEMLEAGGGDAAASFEFALPFHSAWAGSLASITLSGPGGTATLDKETDRPAAIVRDRLTGQVRAVLRNLPAHDDAWAILAALAAEPSLDVLTSRGIPQR